MTFQRSLNISIAIHAMIFGAAIAFAWHGSGVFLVSEHVVPVSLVALDAGTDSGGGAGKQNWRIRDEAGQDVKSPVEQQQETPREVHEVSADMSAVSMKPTKGNFSDSGPLDHGKGDQITAFSGSGQSGGGGGPGSIAPYQWAVIESAIERSKSYPRMARERGIQGVVRVRFKLKPSGAVETVEIVKSSGYDILDEATVRTVYRASPLPYYTDGWVEVPMAYILN